MSKKTDNSNNNPSEEPSGGRPATADEQNQINEILTMLRNQNLNASSIPLNQDSNSAVTATATASNGSGNGNDGVVGATAGNLIAENATGFVGNEEGDDGRKKHAFWDTQVSMYHIYLYFAV